MRGKPILAISFLRIGAVGAAIVVAAFVAGQLNAQPKTRIEAENATIGATQACAGIWSTKDKEDLDSDDRYFKEGMQTKLDAYRTGREELVKNIGRLQDQLDAVSMEGVLSSAAKVETQERADQKGFLSKAQAKAIAVSVWESSNQGKEAELKNKIATLRSELAAVQRRMIGWFAYATIVAQCFEDQQKYLEKQGNKPVAAVPPTTPPPQDSGDITLAKGTVSGSWHATCTYDKSNYPADGRFSMLFKGDKSISTAFVDGSAASVSGSIKPGGAVTANGSVNMSGFAIRITMQGKIERRKDGSLFGYGTFQSNDGGDIKCKGTWNG